MTINISAEAVGRLAYLCQNAGLEACTSTLRALSAALTASQAETAAAYEAAALAMRERAALAAENGMLPLIADQCAASIRALPTTFTDAELLAAVEQFPAVRALVEAAERAKTSIENGGGGGVIDVVWLDGPTNESVCDHLAAALAPFRK